MTSFELWLGDVDEYLSQQCQFSYPDAVLIDSTNVHQYLTSPPQIGYTSLGDIGDLQNLLDLCRKAHHIHYCPPGKWSDQDRDGKSSQKFWTEYILQSIILTSDIEITNFKVIDQEYSCLESDMLIEHRKTDSRQGWAIGCSITAGFGVLPEQRWQHLLYQDLELEYSTLAAGGSSIVWQSDQICRSDIRKNDLVIWAMPSPDRKCIFSHGKLMHVNAGSFKTDPSLLELIKPDDLTSQDLLYQNIMAIRRVKNYCHKIGAELLVIGVLYDFQGVLAMCDLPNRFHSLIWPETFFDLGTDGEHPGPKHHSYLAKKILSMYNSTKI